MKSFKIDVEFLKIDDEKTSAELFELASLISKKRLDNIDAKYENIVNEAIKELAIIDVDEAKAFADRNYTTICINALVNFFNSVEIKIENATDEIAEIYHSIYITNFNSSQGCLPTFFTEKTDDEFRIAFVHWNNIIDDRIEMNNCGEDATNYGLKFSK